MLQLEQVNQFYGESHTLWDVNLDVVQGKCTVLMGRNGVGKSTLLKTVMGLIPMAKGNMLFNGSSLNVQSVDARARIGIGYVPQGREIFNQLTVEENMKVALAARPRGMRQIPPFIFNLFPVLADMLHRRGGDLSGGQQQQLAIGRALVTQPRLLILDEPTEGIQPNIVQEIGRIIRMLNEEHGLTVLLVEQKIPFARKLADRFCILDKGRSVAAGEMDELTEALITQHLQV